MTSTFSKPMVLASAALSATALVGVLLYERHRRKQWEYWNSDFVEVGSVVGLNLFPIKSCKAIKVDWLDCEATGVVHGELRDRNFVVVDAKHDGLLQSARQYPKLVLIESFVKDDVLTVSLPDGKSMQVDLKHVQTKNDTRTASLFNNNQEGLDCGDEIGKFIGEFLGTTATRDMRLLFYKHGLPTERNLKADKSFWLNPVPEVEDTPAFQDQSACMLLCEASVADLNKQLAAKNLDAVTMSRFRPTIAISGPQAYDEDRWLQVRIGDTEITCYSPCTRCVLTTVNPDNGTLDRAMQPLKTLREYRLAPEGRLREKYNKSPVFGVYSVFSKLGRICVGDKVFVRYKPSPL